MKVTPLLAFACRLDLPPCFLRKKEREQRQARKQGGLNIGLALRREVNMIVPSHRARARRGRSLRSGLGCGRGLVIGFIAGSWVVGLAVYSPNPEGRKICAEKRLICPIILRQWIYDAFF